MSRGGEFTIDVWEGGYPIWCSLSYCSEDKGVLKFRHDELSDLIYAATKALEEAQREEKRLGV